jgi:hypothetical protein
LLEKQGILWQYYSPSTFMNIFKPRNTLLAALLITLTLAGGIFAQPTPGRKPLKGHVPAAVGKLQAIGRLEATTNLYLAVGLPLRDPDGLTSFLKELYDPASTNYHHYLTPEQFTERFGPTEQDYAKVIDFLQTNGFSVASTHPNRLLVDVTGTVANIERTFRVTIHLYQHPTEKRSFYSPDVEPSVPQGVQIESISGLENFMPPRPMNLRRAPLPNLRSPKSGAGQLQGLLTPAATDNDDVEIVAYATGSGPGGDFLGGDFRAAYAPGVTLTGVGQTIGLFEFGPYFTNDIALYQQRAGLPSIAITNILLDGFTGIPAAGADDGEETLDIDMAMAMAPGATILVYEGNSAIDIFNRMATDNRARQMSCSFGFYPPPSSMDNVFMQFAAQGQNLFVASGDSGAYSTNLIFAPADDPNITAVGGTSLTTAGAGGPWLSEKSWSGSGGGITPHYAIPSYQAGMNTTTNHGSGTQRNFPDVAILAEPTIFWYLKNGQSGTVGGTSAAAPLWAGFMALVNQQAVANGKSPMGNLNSIIYGIGNGSNNYTTVFHDISTGNNTNSGSPTNFFAVSGYDLATGWGSPNGSNLINMLAAPTDALQITPGIGFSVTTPFGVPFNPASLDFSLTNSGLAPVTWTLVNTSLWLNATSSGGTLLPAAAAATVTISLNTASATNLASGLHYATVLITNTISGVGQSRLFTLNVSSANFPIAVSGFNAGVMVPSNATTTAQQATAFDIPNNLCFYQAGLNSNPQVSGSGGTQGLPQSGLFVSQADGLTTFQFGPYGSPTNALLLGDLFPNSGTLTLSAQQSYNSLAVLASSANGSANATLVIHFADGSSSASMNFNAQDWFNTTTNVAVQGFGRLELNNGLFTENNGSSNPNLYQTILNLAAQGLNQPVTSITFSKPALGGSQDTGIFALSGALMPPQVVITRQPQNVTTSNPAAGVTLSVVAMGTPALAYQWYSGSPPGGSPLANQTNSTLNFTPATTNQAGNYYVVVSNAYNSVTSTPATLTVYTSPIITQQPSPTNLFLFTGQPAKFSVGANGAVPLNYFWYNNGALLASGTSSSYNIASVQTNNSGNYSAILSNAYGMATSSVVSLTVLPAPTYPFAQAVLVDHPVAYWRLDETSGSIAHDYVGGNNGAYTNVQLGQTGDNLLDTHKAARFGSLSANNSYVANIPIDFATAGNATFSVEAWVNGAAQGGDNGIITKGTGAGGEQFNLDCGSDAGPGPNHSFRFFVRDAGGGAHRATGTIAPNSQWHHVVGVCDETHGMVILYVDGVSNASGTITAGSGLLSSANALTLGSRQSSATSVYDLQFVGLMEEMAIYNYVLSPIRILSHYTAASNRPPVFTTNPFSVQPANAGQPYSGTIATNATDPNGDTINFNKLSGPSWLTVASNGALSGTPLSADDGTNSFVVSASDPGNLSNSATMTLTVNAAPAIIALASLQGTNLVLSWSGGIAPYQVQMATNLTSPAWQTIAGPTNGTSVSLSPSNDAGFYRIVGE